MKPRLAPTTNDVHVVVLMAGESHRFMESGGERPKQFAPVGQTSLAQFTIVQVRQFTDAPIHVVVAPTGLGADVGAEVEPLGVQVTVAANAADGVHASALHGVGFAVSQGARHVLLLLGDDPMAVRDIPVILDAASTFEGDAVAVRRPAGGPHPILFLAPHQLARNDFGIAALRDRLRTLWIDRDSTQDVDTLDDLAALQETIVRPRQ